MRTNEERVAAVQNRVREMEQQKRANRARILELSALAACLALLVLTGLAMPAVIAAFPEETAAAPGSAASIFWSGKALGYIVIGVLAFALSACFTVLCVRLRRYRESKQEDDHD